MPRKSKLDIAETIRKMEAAGELAAEADALLQAEKDPMKALIALNEALDNWEESGVSAFIKDNPKYSKFVKDMSRQLTAEIYIVMRHTISQLHKKLQEAEGYVQPKELSAILGELGRQLAVFQKIEETQLSTPSETELDKQIRELEKELGAFNGGNSHTG